MHDQHYCSRRSRNKCSNRPKNYDRIMMMLVEVGVVMAMMMRLMTMATTTTTTTMMMMKFIVKQRTVSYSFCKQQLMQVKHLTTASLVFCHSAR